MSTTTPIDHSMRIRSREDDNKNDRSNASRQIRCVRDARHRLSADRHSAIDQVTIQITRGDCFRVTKSCCSLNPCGAIDHAESPKYTQRQQHGD